ncbi:hypothetical protein MRX96_008682 [Rhipicephalus microplus]
MFVAQEQRARIPDHFLLFEDRSSEKFSKRPGYDRVLFLFVVTLVLVVIGSVFVLIYLPYFQPSEELHTTGIDTHSGRWIPTVSVPDFLPLPPAFVPNKTHAVVPVPSNPGENPRVCSTPICRIAAQWLRARINPSVDPCQDFYGYVCSKFRGQDETVEVGAQSSDSL